jgi:hypothetical protein
MLDCGRGSLAYPSVREICASSKVRGVVQFYSANLNPTIQQQTLISPPYLWMNQLVAFCFPVLFVTRLLVSVHCLSLTHLILWYQ